MSLLVKNLLVYLKGKKILENINLEIKSGKIHALMGPNGSGKSTLAQVIMGNPNYKLRIENPLGDCKLQINRRDMTNLNPDERAKAGLFLAFQNPVAIPGVSVANLLKTAYQVLKDSNKQRVKDAKSVPYNPALSVWEFNEMLVERAKTLGIPQEFLRRSLNEAFSGGEKKKLEMLQATVLSPKYAIFDEIDTGLDVDALKIVARGIAELKKQGMGILVITHYQRILKFAKPDFVHILVGGKIVESGGYKLVQEVERKGYKRWMGKGVPNPKSQGPDLPIRQTGKFK